MSRRRASWAREVTAWGSSRREVLEVPAGCRGLRVAKTRGSRPRVAAAPPLTRARPVSHPEVHAETLNPLSAGAGPPPERSLSCLVPPLSSESPPPAPSLPPLLPPVLSPPSSSPLLGLQVCLRPPWPLYVRFAGSCVWSFPRSPPSLLVLSASCSLPAWPPGVYSSFLPLLWSFFCLCLSCLTMGQDESKPSIGKNHTYFSLSSCSVFVPCLPRGTRLLSARGSSVCLEVTNYWVAGASLRDVCASVLLSLVFRKAPSQHGVRSAAPRGAAWDLQCVCV